MAHITTVIFEDRDDEVFITSHNTIHINNNTHKITFDLTTDREFSLTSKYLSDSIKKFVLHK